jgi:hypothetical protein
MATKAQLEADNADLQAQLAALSADSGPRAPVAQYPKAKYKACPVSARWPNGYEARRAESPEAEAILGEDWVDSPADLPV